VTALHQIARQLEPQRRLREQRMLVHDFFETAAGVLREYLETN
jgi:hypothetical protein